MEVEKNVPIPARYPFDKMEVGDNMKFIVRIMPDRTLRCWRTE